MTQVDPRKTFVWSSLRRRIFGIDRSETSVARRGFHSKSSAATTHFEQIGVTFVNGYHAALTDDRPGALAALLDSEPREMRGFAYEGAAMGLAMLDAVTPWRRNRWRRFLAGPGQPHVYMMHVGAGWTLGRLPFSVRRLTSPMDPLLAWLAIDGYAFHEAYFRTDRAVIRGDIPTRLRGYARTAWDLGLGRGIWFVDGADVERVAARIGGFAHDRRATLWSGIGLASAYAGGVSTDELHQLTVAAGEHRPSLAQGVTFAAKARDRAGNPAPHTELACGVICSMSAIDAASVTDEALAGAIDQGKVPAFEIWRQRIHARFA